MKEKLLQYIWKFRYFNLAELKTVDGDALQLIHPGTHNTDQGPDFLNAKIKINETLWVGHVEVHLTSKDWNRHKHSADPHYKNIILHVVWHHDAEIRDINGVNLPTIELKERVANPLLQRYELLMEKEQDKTQSFIPCQNLLTPFDEFKITAWKSRLVAERLERKTKKVFQILEQTGYHWEETLWQLTAANFGGKMNGTFFRQIAETLPQKILALHKNQPIVIQALLFGQAGLLEETFTDKYPLLLQKEYAFYKKKYQLQKADGLVQFARMRPANFPTVRLAQLSALIAASTHLFSKINEASSIKEVKQLFASCSPNDFWLYHYKLNDKAHENLHEKQLGNQMIDNLIINTVCPILFAYSMHLGDLVQKEKVLEWLEEVASEKNHITTGFKNLGFKNENAFDSQALIELKNSYCDKKRCLECSIGNLILSAAPFPNKETG